MIKIGKINDKNKGKEIILEKEKNGCIRCVSHCTDKDGYTRIMINKKHERLFRVLYEKENGKIPNGMVLRHLCNNSWCCNINHLKIGTHKDNMNDMVNSGRSTKGIKREKNRGINNPQSKLTEEDVKKIYLSNLSSYKLSKIYGVSKTTISYIKNGKCWEWLTENIKK